MELLTFDNRITMLSAYGIILIIDLVIIIMGWVYRKKFDAIPPRFFGIMSGKFTEHVVRKFGNGFTSNCIFMLPVFLISMFWLFIMANIAPPMVDVLVGVLIGCHLTLLLLSLMKLSILSVLEAKYKKSFHKRVSKAISAFLDGK